MDRRSLARTTVAASVIAVLVACNAIAGLDGDFTLGAADDADVGPLPEAGSDAGGTDAGATDAPVETGCAAGDPAVVFCDDFESTRDGGWLGWDRGEAIGGTVAIADGIGKGGTRGFRAKLTVADAGSRKVVLWKNVLGAVPARYVLRFSFAILEKTTNYFAIGVFGVTPAGGSLLTYGLAAYDDARLDQTDPPAAANIDATAFTIGQFYSATITIEKGATTFGAKLAIDGKEIDARPNALLGSTVTPPEKIEIGLGAFFTSASGTGEIVIDDVELRRE